jgi:hypothetical protein
MLINVCYRLLLRPRPVRLFHPAEFHVERVSSRVIMLGAAWLTCSAFADPLSCLPKL